ncbi:MAG: hypoxanthine phosphoribosyltransferase [Peptococcaceae bacterium]|nr:hypoxanthine phosphoribosyltransferase [Peptococcaceae bacterium]MDH7525007.1 hypoxanthine phosphoribosyltransferase [Peptococcaceae bacterium]
MTAEITRILISEAEIRSKVKELGELITQDYKNKDLFVVGILKGSIIFLSDLIREIPLPLQMDFMAVSSYGASTSTSGVVRILKDLEADIMSKDVLIVEDIVDTGLTLSYLKENLMTRSPASLKVCAFLDKPGRRRVPLVPDYNGYEIPDEFVVGYGLDYNEEFRNLPYVAVIETKSG